jgi:hypothetical protein
MQYMEFVSNKAVVAASVALSTITKLYFNL